MNMKPTYLGYSASTVRVGDSVVSYPHNKTCARFFGDVFAIDRENNKMRVNYNRTELPDGTISESGPGLAILTLAGTFLADGISTSLDINLILRGETNE